MGYDLTRLIVGSEGQLALITEATLKLLPLAEAVMTLQASFSTVSAAAAAVTRVMGQSQIPCALEFMDTAAVALARSPGGANLAEDTQALLMVEVDGAQNTLQAAADAVTQALQGDGLISVERAADTAHRQQLWQARKALSPALREIAPGKINEDVVVPVSRLTELVQGVHQLGDTHHTRIVTFGHAGNGNLHVNLLFDDQDPQASQRAQACLDELFSLVLSLQGSLSGEHGVGMDKAAFVKREIDAATLQMMEQVRAVFDPHGILNPGKSSLS